MPSASGVTPPVGSSASRARASSTLAVGGSTTSARVRPERHHRHPVAPQVGVGQQAEHRAGGGLDPAVGAHGSAGVDGDDDGAADRARAHRGPQVVGRDDRAVGVGLAPLGRGPDGGGQRHAGTALADRLVADDAAAGGAVRAGRGGRAPAGRRAAGGPGPLSNAAPASVCHDPSARCPPWGCLRPVRSGAGGMSETCGGGRRRGPGLGLDLGFELGQRRVVGGGTGRSGVGGRRRGSRPALEPSGRRPRRRRSPALAVAAALAPGRELVGAGAVVGAGSTARPRPARRRLPPPRRARGRRRRVGVGERPAGPSSARSSSSAASVGGSNGRRRRRWPSARPATRSTSDDGGHRAALPPGEGGGRPAQHQVGPQALGADAERQPAGEVDHRVGQVGGHRRGQPGPQHQVALGPDDLAAGVVGQPAPHDLGPVHRIGRAR